MGIFGEQKQSDPSLLAVFAAPPDNKKYLLSSAQKTLAKESDGIMAILKGTGETCLVVAHDINDNAILVVTDRRTFTIKRSRIQQELSHQEVAETILGAMPNGNMLVVIESYASRLDYSPNDPMRFEKIISAEVATPRIGNIICTHIDKYLNASSEGVEDMEIFRRRQKQHSNEHELSGDIISMMERLGRYEFNPQASTDNPAEIGQLIGDLYSSASADPGGFLVALAEAVLPVGGWAVYGASCTLWECFGSDIEAFRQHPSYNAIMSAAIDFLRANGVPPMMVKGYEWQYWVNNGGTSDTWVPRRPIPSQEEAPITALLPGESRRVAQLTSKPDSNVILVRRNGDGRYCALIDAKWSDEDPRRVQNEWKFAESLYELYIQIGLAMQVPTYWYDRELEPYFPLPRPRI
jgi:hypothetical protein